MENRKPAKYGAGKSAGTATVLVLEPGIRDYGHPMWEWLRSEGFTLLCGGGGTDWVYINLNSMIYMPGKYGIKLASPIREHAITLDEFRTIWNIYRRYEDLEALAMPDDSDDRGVQKRLALEKSAASFSWLYKAVIMEREIPHAVLEEHLAKLEGKHPTEQRRIREELALELMAQYSFRRDIELDLREMLRQKHITEKNWLKHLDKMSEREITFMLEQLPDKACLDRSRRTRPMIPDRLRAEFLRDFGL